MPDNDVKGIIDILKQAAEEDFQEQVEIDWEALKIAAKEFLQWNTTFKSSKIQAQKRARIAMMSDV